MDKVMLISCDGHACGPAEEYMEYMDSATRHAAYSALLDDERQNFAYFKSTVGILQPAQVELIDDRDAIRSGKARGTYDARCRLEEMDVEGIAAELMFPGAYMGTVPFVVGAVGTAHPPELRDGGALAYNRWLADRLLAEGDGRLFGVAMAGSYHDLSASIAAATWAAERPFVAAACPGSIRDDSLPRLYDPYWDRWWAACVDLGLAVTIHAGFRVPVGQGLEGKEAMIGTPELAQIDRSRFFYEDEAAPFDEAMYAPRRALWEMVVGGVFDRHPDLRVVPTEVRVDWVPGLFAFLDEKFAAGEIPTQHPPSHYWANNCYGCSSPLRPPDLERRAEIGLSRFLFGRDFPHAESMWPNTNAWLRATLRGIPEADARAVLGENALACYGFDGAHLAAVAARIGPTIDELVDGPEVDPRYIENFNRRAGFNKPVYPLLLDDVEQKLREDLDAVARLAS